MHCRSAARSSPTDVPVDIPTPSKSSVTSHRYPVNRPRSAELTENNSAYSTARVYPDLEGPSPRHHDSAYSNNRPRTHPSPFESSAGVPAGILRPQN